MPKKKIYSLFGVVKKIRGHDTETKVSISCKTLSSLTPPWFQGIEKAEDKLDQEGVDFIISSDIGPLYLQVKSSSSGKKEFDKKKRTKMIAVVVVSQNDSEEEVQRKVYKALSKIRSEILSRRNTDQ